MEQVKLIKDVDFNQINQLYEECLTYLQSNAKDSHNEINEINLELEERISNEDDDGVIYETIQDNKKVNRFIESLKPEFIVENEIKNDKSDSVESLKLEIKSGRLRKLSQTLPRIIITQSTASLNVNKSKNVVYEFQKPKVPRIGNKHTIVQNNFVKNPPPLRNRSAYGDFPKRLVSKGGGENVALISNVPFEKIRLLNDTFHTLINLRWRWIVIGTVVVHFTMWAVFALFWYMTALAHYDFEPDPPNKPCITGGKDFITIFLASVEAQTTIGFGDRAIDEECPESIFLFIIQLILGTGLSGVLTCVVYAKLTRPEKLSRDGVGFSKKSVISIRDGRLCLMMRAWDLNYDHIISSEFIAHFINTYRTKEGEIIRYYARTLPLKQRQFLLWPVTLVHEIDEDSPLYRYTPEDITNVSFEITVGLKGASASLGTFTQSQTSYMPREVIWGHRFPSVVKYNIRKRKYEIDHTKLDAIEPVDTPHCSAFQFYKIMKSKSPPPSPHTPGTPGTPSSFSDQLSGFHLSRSSSFRKKKPTDQKSMPNLLRA
ncbi:ATP-sensitive inward rectifier potassium channel 11-like [Leguminivora glycinivorella]|uniref:ATP-sensitive inward rectifier potassium channel 11-like n=1 Tax=Leguminivora glycinivorella TaxID=1035111 RepID=UPI00200E7E57|nr:ATP-sensitive inward rectifier potassium channel 11-like [Leguminivora glycinivorella]